MRSLTSARRKKGLAQRALPVAGLSGPHRSVRPHHFGPHVRACRHQSLRHVLSQERAAARRRLCDGVALDRPLGGPSVTSLWISKYIFPGGYIPSLSEVLTGIEKSGLLVTDIEILRLHYAETLKAWRERFLAHREEVEHIYDLRFVRM
jgi:cyclopropane-fatty-acyl-phospholipid synthase